MKLNVRVWWMENTDTRNAFYQVFEFTDAILPALTCVVVTHYGPLKISEGEFSRPVNGGTVTVKKADSQNGMYVNGMHAVSRKFSSGYRLVSSHQKEVDHTWLNSTFGAQKAHQILLSLGVTTANHSIDLPITPSEDVFSFDDLPEHAGSW